MHRRYIRRRLKHLLPYWIIITVLKKTSKDTPDAFLDENLPTHRYKNDMAILYSNRSLCNLKLNKIDKSYDDAKEATEYDPTYLKGYWRLGQACGAKNKYGSAVEAYIKACELDPHNKILRKECDKAKEKAKGNTINDIGEKSYFNRSSSENSHHKMSKIKQSHKETMKKKDFKADNYNDSLRGYKIVNGKKNIIFSS